MTTRPCERRAEVLAAAQSDGLMAAPALMAHVDGCQACARLLAELTFAPAVRAALDEYDASGPEPDHDPGEVADPPALDAPAGRLELVEALLLLSDFGEPAAQPEALSAADRARLYRAARALDAAAPDAPSIADRLGLDDHARPEHDAPGPAEPDLAEPDPVTAGPDDAPRDPATGRRSTALRLVLPLMVAAAAIAAVFVLRAPTEPAFVSADRETLIRRGDLLGMELALGDRRCDPTRDPAGWVFQLGLVTPCKWSARETFVMNVRVEPGADARYVAVLSRDRDGRVDVLYPDPGVEVTPLQATRDRVSDHCRGGLCWLEGGHYEVAPTGEMVVVAVFSTSPLPVEEMARSWAPWRWTGRDRLVERFELEVVE